MGRKRKGAGSGRTRVLFVCLGNKMRSRTGEDIFKGHPRLDVASAGTIDWSTVVLCDAHVLWADTVFVMEKTMEQFIRTRFPAAAKGKRIVCLDIPDRYQRGNPQLIQILKSKVCPILGIPKSEIPDIGVTERLFDDYAKTLKVREGSIWDRGYYSVVAGNVSGDVG